MGRVISYARPASMTSEAVTSHGLLGCPKNIEGSIFRGQDRTSKLCSDLDLGGPDDLRYDLRGHRGRNSKNRYFSHFEGRTSRSTTKQRLFGAIEAMETVEAT